MVPALLLLIPLLVSKAPTPSPCDPNECQGHRMGMPNWQCEDGRTGGPACLRGKDGRCAWTVVECEPKDSPPTPKGPNAGAFRVPPDFKPDPSARTMGEAIDLEIRRLRASLPIIKMPWCFVEGGCHRPRKLTPDEEARHDQWVKLLPYGGQSFTGRHVISRLSTLESQRQRQECAAGPRPAPSETEPARFVLDEPHPHFKPRHAWLQRFLDCEYKGKELVKTNEYFYLTVGSHELKVPGYSHEHKNHTLFEDRYFIECTGGLRALLGGIQERQLFSALDRTFTLPCGYAFFAKEAPESYDKAARMSGVFSYGVHSAWLTFTKIPTREDPSYALKLSIQAENPVELLELKGTIEGKVRTAVRKLSIDRHHRHRPKGE